MCIHVYVYIYIYIYRYTHIHKHMCLATPRQDMDEGTRLGAGRLASTANVKNLYKI